MSQNRISEARAAKGWTQQYLAELMGTTQQTIQRYETGARNITASTLKKLSETLGVTVAYLLGMTGNGTRSDGYAETPLFDSIAACVPIEMLETDTRFPIPAEMHEKYPNAFLVRVEGESMNRILPNGCYALVDPCKEIDLDGQPYAIRVGELDATVKRVRRTDAGFELLPDSTDSAFQPQELKGDDGSTFAVIGRVIWHCLPFDWAY